MVRALMKVLPGDAIRTGATVRRIAASGGPGEPYRVELESGEIVSGRAVVLAAPAYASGRIVSGLDPELARLCDEVPYASSATVALGFRREDVRHPLNGSGFVVPSREGSGILAASWLSSKWPGRAPEDRVLLRTFVGGARDPHALEHSDEQLVARSLDAIRGLLHITGAPILARVYRWPRASAQHNVGQPERMAAIERRLVEHPGLYVTGSGFRGAGIPDCVADGRATAVKVSEWLQQVGTRS
jgi:oxygen-dependent protoporphyrinogen oxidase